MNTVIIDQEIQTLFSQSLQSPQIIPPFFVNGNENLSVRVDTYTSLSGDGFRVIGRLKEDGKTYVKILNHGPDVGSNTDWQEYTSILPFQQ